MGRSTTFPVCSKDGSSQIANDRKSKRPLRPVGGRPKINLSSKVKDYARKKKLDGRGSAMEVGAVEKDEDSAWGSSWGPPEAEAWINAMSKGKGKSKGKG